MLDALRQTGQEDDTLVVFTSDHGEGLAAHHWTGKMNFYEEEAAVPLIVSWKGVTPAGRIDRDAPGLDARRAADDLRLRRRAAAADRCAARACGRDREARAAGP